MFREQGPAAATAAVPEQPAAFRPQDAGRWILKELGRATPGAASAEDFDGPIEDVDRPQFSRPDGKTPFVLALLATDAAGFLRPSAGPVVGAARLAAAVGGWNVGVTVALVVPAREEIQRRALSQLLTWYRGDVVVVVLPGAEASDEVKARLLAESLGRLESIPLAVVGESWAESAFAHLRNHPGRGDPLVAGVCLIGGEDNRLILETGRGRGRLRARQTRALQPGRTCWVVLAEDAEVEGRVSLPPTAAKTEGGGNGHPWRSFRVERWAPPLERVYDCGDLQQLLADLKEDTGLVSLADADFIIDVGFGVGNRDGFEEVIEPLERALRDLGVQSLVIGGSRKVTEELHLLPLDRQIGQSGVSVNPRVLLAVGISGAPQHLNYISPRAQILAFNRDPDAPLLTLNQRQPLPKVYPVVGDLFETVPAFIAALRQEQTGPVESTPV
jgi:hypothetical protein